MTAVPIVARKHGWVVLPIYVTFATSPASPTTVEAPAIGVEEVELVRYADTHPGYWIVEGRGEPVVEGKTLFATKLDALNVLFESLEPVVQQLAQRLEDLEVEIEQEEDRLLGLDTAPTW